MEIVYLGHSSFKIKTKLATVVTDPYTEKLGRFPKDVEADVLLVSHDHFDHNNVAAIKGEPFVICGAGEYEVKGVSVIGIKTFHDEKQGKDRGPNVVYVVEADGLRICHLGDLGHVPTQEQLAEMGPIDVVMVPVGGVYTIDARTACEVVKKIDPWVAIPMHYGWDSLAGVEVFLKEMGVEGLMAMPKFVITAEKLPSELQVVVMEKK